MSLGGPLSRFHDGVAIAQGPIPEVWVVITRCERIDVDVRLSLLEIKRADQVDVLPLEPLAYW